MVNRTLGCRSRYGVVNGRHHRERGRDRGHPQLSRQSVPQRIDFLAHGAAVADDAARPVEHALAFGREALEARTAIHQQHAHLLFELLDARRQGRLRYATGFGGPAEMLLARQRQDEKIKLVDI